MPDPSSPSDPRAQFARVVDLLGEEGFARLRRAFVAVLGLGGVGSHCAVALARSGVGRLRLVDFDTLSWTSLNRHACATTRDVGRPKAALLQEAIAQIAPDARVEAAHAFFHHDTADELLAGPPDFVVDAIDSVTPKAALLQACVARRLPVLSCMGASARLDPTALRFADISKTEGCPLARAVRDKLRRDYTIRSGVVTLYSSEPARAPLAPDLDDQPLRRGRVRNRLPSLGVMPGIFGYAAAGHVIQRLAGER
jgi:tRNA threonylcarbamoyladenosine dehydratase